MHSLRVLRAFLSIGVANLLQYRSDFAIAVVNAGVGLVTAVLALSVVFGNTADLRGWTADQLLVLVGVHFFISGLVGVVIRPSMEAMMEGIRLGTFDFVLTKPADAQLLASARVMSPQALTDVVVGLGVVGFGLSRIGATLHPAAVVLFAVTLLAGFATVYSFLLLLSTCAFWFVKLDNILVIFQALFGNAGRWPVPIFPGWMRPVLTFVVPIAFAVTVPAQALTGQLSVGGAAGSVGVAVLFLVASRAFWLVALRRYTGASA
ncbi:ABC transporter permease [uncultured Friedmanniella sp.]|uniref:ABC transporter permease n=1 Tax=uncultured Friedmanniella sp. TaxID=335381 RepID=UPI0035CC2F81